MRAAKYYGRVIAAVDAEDVNSTYYINGRHHDGAFDADDLIAAIDAQLVGAG